MEGRAPLVSVVTVFHDRAAHVAESVGSVLRQEGVDFELVAVDDGSTDDTLARLRATDDPRLRVVAQANTGFTPAINRAIRESRGRYVAIHGAGDVSLPGRLRAQAAVLDARPEVGVVACHVLNDAKVGDRPYEVRPPAGLPFRETLLRRNLFTHGEVMFRRDLWDRVGGYREAFTYSQDLDLWLRMSRHAGYDVVPELLYHRRRFPGSVSHDPDKALLQAYAAEWAVQLARAADGRSDALDRYGPLAAFLREPSAELARSLAWTGAQQMVRGNIAPGWRMVLKARQERMTPQVLAIWMLCATHRFAPLWPLGRRILAARLLGFNR